MGARGAKADSDDVDAGGLRALGALADLELHPLVLLQGAEATALDFRVVHEDVGAAAVRSDRSEEHTSELQSHSDLVCRLLLEKKKRDDDDYSTHTDCSKFRP